LFLKSGRPDFQKWALQGVLCFGLLGASILEASALLESLFSFSTPPPSCVSHLRRAEKGSSDAILVYQELRRRVGELEVRPFSRNESEPLARFLLANSLIRRESDDGNEATIEAEGILAEQFRTGQFFTEGSLVVLGVWHASELVGFVLFRGMKKEEVGNKSVHQALVAIAFSTALVTESKEDSLLDAVIELATDVLSNDLLFLFSLVKTEQTQSVLARFSPSIGNWGESPVFMRFSNPRQSASADERKRISLFLFLREVFRDEVRPLAVLIQQVRETEGLRQSERVSRIASVLKAHSGQVSFIGSDVSALASEFVSAEWQSHSAMEILERAAELWVNEQTSDRRFQRLDQKVVMWIDSARRTGASIDSFQLLRGYLRSDARIASYRLSNEQLTPLIGQLTDPANAAESVDEIVERYLAILGLPSPLRLASNRFAPYEIRELQRLRFLNGGDVARLRDYLYNCPYLTSLHLGFWDLAKIATELSKPDNQSLSAERIIDSIQL
jgi:hypothetical protein